MPRWGSCTAWPPPYIIHGPDLMLHHPVNSLPTPPCGCLLMESVAVCPFQSLSRITPLRWRTLSHHHHFHTPCSLWCHAGHLAAAISDTGHTTLSHLRVCLWLACATKQVACEVRILGLCVVAKLVDSRRVLANLAPTEQCKPPPVKCTSATARRQHVTLHVQYA